MLMQLVAAVILEKFEDLVKAEVAVISQKSLDQFVDKWSVFDPDGTSFITVVQLTQLISELNPPLGINSTKIASTLKLMAVVKDLDIPVRQMAIREPGSAEPENNSSIRVTRMQYAACVKYHDTFIALVRRAHTIQPDDEELLDMSSSESDNSQDEAEDFYAEPDDPEQVKASRHHHHHHQESQAPSASPEGQEEGPERDEISLQYSNATVAQDYAARQLQHACIAWRENRLQVNKGRDLNLSIPLNMKAFSPLYRQNTSGRLDCIGE